MDQANGPEDGPAAGGTTQNCLCSWIRQWGGQGQGRAQIWGLAKTFLLTPHGSWCLLSAAGCVCSRGLSGSAAGQLSHRRLPIPSFGRGDFLSQPDFCNKEIAQTKWHKQNKFIFSQFWRLGSPRPRCQLIQLLASRALFLTCRWLPSCCVLAGQRERKRGRERGEGKRQKEKEKRAGVCALFLFS